MANFNSWTMHKVKDRRNAERETWFRLARQGDLFAAKILHEKFKVDVMMIRGERVNLRERFGG